MVRVDILEHLYRCFLIGPSDFYFVDGFGFSQPESARGLVPVSGMTEPSIHFTGLTVVSCPDRYPCPDRLALKLECEEIIPVGDPVLEETHRKIPAFALFFCEPHITGGYE